MSLLAVRTHLRCSKYSANSLSVFPANPSASFLDLHNVKTDSLSRIIFKDPGNLGLPGRTGKFGPVPTVGTLLEKCWKSVGTRKFHNSVRFQRLELQISKGWKNVGKVLEICWNFEFPTVGKVLELRISNGWKSVGTLNFQGLEKCWNFEFPRVGKMLEL